jgi:hypothetical protein
MINAMPASAARARPRGSRSRAQPRGSVLLALPVGGRRTTRQLGPRAGPRRAAPFRSELGIAEATLGHRDAALNVEHELASLRPRYDRGTPILMQAEIAANLGDRDRSIVLLQQALTRGIGLQQLGAGMFGNSNLAPLYGYPLFERMLRPDEPR